MYITETDIDKRFGLLVLPYEYRDMAIAKELLVDYEEHHIYAVSKDGTHIIAITKDISDRVELLYTEGGKHIHVINNGDDMILNDALEDLRNFINSTVQGLAPKQPARLCSDINIVNMKGIPDYLIDNVEPKDGDSILLIGQEDAKLNGKWIINEGDWYRSTDLDEQAEINGAPFFFILEGEKYAEKGFILATDNPVINESELEWVIFSRCDGIVPGLGLVKVGNEISLAKIVEAGTGTRVTVDETGRVIKYDSPSTLSEMGITDGVSTEHIGATGDAHGLVNVDRHGFASKEMYREHIGFMPTLEETEQRLNTKLDDKSEIEFIGDEKFTIELQQKVPIVDNLKTDSANKVLSARQGFILYKLLKELFTNTNEDSSSYFKLWVGTQGQYESLKELDSVTLYYVIDNEKTVNSGGLTGDSGGDNPTNDNVSEVMELIQQLIETKVNRDGDQMTGGLTIGNPENPQDLSVYGKIFINDVDVTMLFALKDHVHDDMVTREYFNNILKKYIKNTDIIPMENIKGLLDELNKFALKDHTHELEGYITADQLADALAMKAAKTHKHKVSDIIGLDEVLNNADIPTKLSQLEQDNLHMTVTKVEKDLLKSLKDGNGVGSGVTDEQLKLHNTSSESHKDIRKLIQSISGVLGDSDIPDSMTVTEAINDIYDKLPGEDDVLKLNHYYASIIIDEPNITDIPIPVNGFDPELHTLLLFINSTYVPPIDYSIEDGYVILQDDVDIMNTTMSFVIMWIDGSALIKGGGSGGTDTETVNQLINMHSNNKETHPYLLEEIKKIKDSMADITYTTTNIIIDGKAGKSIYDVNLPDYEEGKYIPILTINGLFYSDYKLTPYTLTLDDVLEEDSEIKIKLYRQYGCVYNSQDANEQSYAYVLDRVNEIDNKVSNVNFENVAISITPEEGVMAYPITVPYPEGTYAHMLLIDGVVSLNYSLNNNIITIRENLLPTMAVKLLVSVIHNKVIDQTPEVIRNCIVKDDCVDNLESNSNTLPLAARQGSILDRKITEMSEEMTRMREVLAGILTNKGIPTEATWDSIISNLANM